MRRVVGWLAAFTLTTQIGACGQRPTNFTPLFDGTLDGAIIENGGSFTVANGVLRAEGPNGWLRFPQVAHDFRLRLELRIVGDYGNSGVFVRAFNGAPYARGWPNYSYEVEIFSPTAAGPLPMIGGLYRYSMPPGPAVIDREAATAAFTGLNEWQLLEIEVVGTELTTRLNGATVTRASGIDDVRGYIGIQSESSAVEFRRIDIEEIDRPLTAPAGADLSPAVTESEPSGGCYTAVPIRDAGLNDLPIEPVCRVLEQNLNQFCAEPPLVCGIKIAPQFESELTLPTWTPVDLGGRLDLVEATVRAQWQGTTPTAPDVIWAERQPALERALAEERLSVSSAEIDLFQVGRPSRLYRIDPGDCEINNGERLRPDRPDYWDQRLVWSGVRVLPTAESLAQLLETFRMLGRETPNGDALLFRGRAYTYLMSGNTYPADVDNRVMVNRGINYTIPSGPTLFFENVCEIKYRSPKPE